MMLSVTAPSVGQFLPIAMFLSGIINDSEIRYLSAFRWTLDPPRYSGVLDVSSDCPKMLNRRGENSH